MGGISVKDSTATDGRRINVGGTGDAMHDRPIPGTGETSKNRFIVAAAATHPGNETNNSATWVAGDNVTEITISVAAATVAGGIQNDEVVLVAFDALDGASAKTLLENTAFDQDGDRQFDMMFVGQTKTYTGTGYFTRVDVSGLGLTTAYVSIGAQ